MYTSFGNGPYSPSMMAVNPNLALDPAMFDELERELGPVFSLTDEQQIAQQRFSPGPPISQTLSQQFLGTPPHMGFPGQMYSPEVTLKADPSKDHIRKQIEHDIHRELKLQELQQQELMQRMYQTAAPQGSFGPTYDDHYNKSSLAPSGQYETLLNMWAKEKGIDLAARKRKSEDLSDSFGTFSVATEDPKHLAFTKTVPLNNSPVGQYGSPIVTPVPVKCGDFDVAYAKSQLMDLICGEKDLQSFCTKVTNFVCSYMKVRVGGFYMNQRPNPKDWLLCYAFPSATIFDTFFQFNVGFNLIMQAASEKRCFCVHSTSLTNGSLSFLFIPIPAEENPISLGVMVLGTVLTGEADLHTHLVFMDQLRKAISASMLSILYLQQNTALTRKVEFLKLENDVLKQKNRFEKALIGVIATSGPIASESSAAVICTDTMGVITYFSTGAQNMLGYNASELVDRYTPLKLHDPNEVLARAKEIEQEIGKKVNPGFSVIVEKTLRNQGQEEVRNWTYIKKDGTSVLVTVTVKPIYDEEDRSVIGFLEVARQRSNPPNSFAQPL